MTFKTEKTLILSLILLYILVFAVFTFVRHYNFQTQAFDMGIFKQAFWNTLQGRIMQSSIEGVQGINNHLGMHWSPFLFLLLPGYAIFPNPYFLLLAQTAALAIGAWPLYLLAKKILGKESRFPLFIAIAYLLYPSLHWVNKFDFHELPFLIPLLFAAFYFIETKNWLWLGIFSALAALVKEDAILIVLFIGLYLLIKKSSGGNEKKIGLAIVILSFIYFIIATKIIMPSLGGGLFHLSRYSYLGENVPEIIKNVFANPALVFKTIFNIQKLSYVFWLFLPVAFLPIFSGRLLIILIPGLAENLLSSWSSQTSGLYHYDSLLIAGIFFCAVYGLKNFLNRRFAPGRAQRPVLWFLIIALSAAFLARSPVSPFNFAVQLFQKNPHWETYRKIVKMIPDNASVTAETHLVPHLAHREKIYMLGTEPFQTDIIIIDGADLSGFANGDLLQSYADSYMNTGEYNFTILKDRYFILYKKGINLND